MATIQLIAMLAGLLPALFQIIPAVEVLFGAKTGAQKLQAVIGSILPAIETAAPEVLNRLGEAKVVGYLTKVIDGIVAAANAAGVFKTSTPAAGA